VTQGDRLISVATTKAPMRKKTAPKMLTRAMVFALRWKICGIGLAASVGGADENLSSLPYFRGAAPRFIL
jgi:hypothetical protein